MDNRYDILESISQREDREMPEENGILVRIANDIRRATSSCRGNEKEFGSSTFDVNDLEKRAAEQWANENDCWIPFMNIFDLGIPGPCGSESDTYISSDGYVFKVNNMMHCKDSIIIALEKFIGYNLVFCDSAYQFVGFAGTAGRSVFPVVKQRYIKNGVPATQNEIDCYMAALGFEKIEVGKFKNEKFLISDVLPKNVLKDDTGDYFVIDAEISYL